MREWGFWTLNKLMVLSAYIESFNRASQRAINRVYIDLMAGEPENVDKATGAHIDGSARRALAAQPGFTRLAFCEKDPVKAAALRADLAEHFPGDDRYKVYSGDCNDNINLVLADLHGSRRGPAFAFIDQQAAEVHWETLERLAAYREGDRKVELWILASPAMIIREAADARHEAFRARVDRMYGTSDWRRIQDARTRDDISPATYRDEMVNLLRWRLHTELGYEITERLPMTMDSNMTIYDMVFATDHPAGKRIMSYLYGLALDREPALRAEFRRIIQDRKQREHGQDGLFDLDVAEPVTVRSATTWLSAAPWDPTSREWW